jgi:hypothetical protein
VVKDSKEEEELLNKSREMEADLVEEVRHNLEIVIMVLAREETAVATDFLLRLQAGQKMIKVYIWDPIKSFQVHIMVEQRMNVKEPINFTSTFSLASPTV